MLSLAFLEMINSSSYRQKICKSNFIQTLSFLLENSEVVKGSQIMDEFRRVLYLIAESIAKHNKVLVNN